METDRHLEVELNCLLVRSEPGLIRWAASTFLLPPEKLPLTNYTSDFVRGCIGGHAADSRTNYYVRLKHQWLMSFTVRRIIFGKDGWATWLGYRLMHDDGVYVGFGT